MAAPQRTTLLLLLLLFRWGFFWTCAYKILTDESLMMKLGLGNGVSCICNWCWKRKNVLRAVCAWGFSEQAVGPAVLVSGYAKSFFPFESCLLVMFELFWGSFGFWSISPQKSALKCSWSIFLPKKRIYFVVLSGSNILKLSLLQFTCYNLCIFGYFQLFCFIYRLCKPLALIQWIYFSLEKGN